MKSPGRRKSFKRLKSRKSLAEEGEEVPIHKDCQYHVFDGDVGIEEFYTDGVMGQKMFACKFSPEDQYIAMAGEDATIRVYNHMAQKLSYTIKNPYGNAYTGLNWRPVNQQNRFLRNIILTIDCEGEICHTHVPTGRCLDTIHGEGIDPQLFCCDYNRDGSKFAVVGSNPVLKIYDEKKKAMEYELQGEGGLIPGHSMRIYSVKFLESDPNIVLTGGWDERIIIWDLRQENPIRSIYGTYIGGDGIDFADGKILTGSYRDEDTLQLWDFGTTKLIETLPWSKKGGKDSEPCPLYCARFSKVDQSVILACGAHTNEIKLYDRNDQYMQIARVFDISRELYCVDFANEGGFWCACGADGFLRVYFMDT